MSILLQYNTVTPAAVNAEAAQNFGITNITSLYSAAVSVAGQIQKICIPVVGVALLIRFFILMTKLYNEKRVDFMGLGKTFLLILFLFDYTEIMTQINSLISYFTSSVQMMFDKYGSGHTIVDKINDVYTKYEETHPEPGFLDKMSNVMDWIIANCTHMIIVIARAITYITRSLIMVFLFATGPIAILATMFPGFEENLKQWLKYYISVGFWMVTLAVLDLILYYYLDYCMQTNTIDGLTTINIGMAIMYLMAPYLTSRYISSQGSQFMSRMIQTATTAVAFSQHFAKSSNPTITYGTEKSIDAAKGSLSTLSGAGTSHSLPKLAGRAYGSIKNNVIGLNQSEK